MVTAPVPVSKELASDDSAGTLNNISSGVGVLPAEVVVQYHILGDKLEEYANCADDPSKLLENIADRHVNEYFATHDVDYLLAHGREMGAKELKKSIAADAVGLGLEVTFVGITSVHPPSKSEVSDKFHEVINALQQKESSIQEARGEAIRILSEMAGSYEHGKAIYASVINLETLMQNRRDMKDNDPKAADLDKQIQTASRKVDELLSEASGELATINDEALAYRWQRSISELARARRIASEFEAYKLAPRYYRAKLSLTTLAEGIKDRRKIIVSQVKDSTNRPIFRFDFKDPESALDTIIKPQ